MPSRSPQQQRLFGIAYSVKTGDTKLSELDKSLQDKIKSIIDSMSKKKIKEYASTKHKNIDEDNATSNNTVGIGGVSLPSSTSLGSGDIPDSNKQTYVQKPAHTILNFDQFVKKFCNK